MIKYDSNLCGARYMKKSAEGRQHEQCREQIMPETCVQRWMLGQSEATRHKLNRSWWESVENSLFKRMYEIQYVQHRIRMNDWGNWNKTFVKEKYFKYHSHPLVHLSFSLVSTNLPHFRFCLESLPISIRHFTTPQTGWQCLVFRFGNSVKIMM